MSKAAPQPFNNKLFSPKIMTWNLTLLAMSSLRICPAYVQTKVPIGMSSRHLSPHPLKNVTKRVNPITYTVLVFKQMYPCGLVGRSVKYPKRDRPFPSRRPLFHSEAKCKAIDMKILIWKYKSNSFSKKGLALSLVLKVTVFGTRKLPHSNDQDL